MSCVVFLLQLVFSCGSTHGFDVVLFGVTLIQSNLMLCQLIGVALVWLMLDGGS